MDRVDDQNTAREISQKLAEVYDEKTIEALKFTSTNPDDINKIQNLVSKVDAAVGTIQATANILRAT